MEEVKQKVLEKLLTIREGTSEWDSTVALCNGATDRDEQATIIATAIWEREEHKRQLAVFAPSKEELAKIESKDPPAEKTLEEEIIDHIKYMEFSGIGSFSQFKDLWENRECNFDSLETYAEIYEGYARKLTRMILRYKYETKQ